MSRSPKIPVSIKKQAPPKQPIASVLFQTAFSAHSAGRLGDAENGYRRVLVQDPRHADALHLLGKIRLHQNDFDGAETLIRQSLSLDECAIFLDSLALVLRKTNRFTQAEETYRRALDLNPDDARIHNNFGNLLSDVQRPSEAEAEYRRALEIKPDYPEALHNVGMLLMDRQCLPEAEAVYRRALELNPDYVEAHLHLGNLLAATNRWPEAEVAYHRALRLSPEYAEAKLNLGFLCLSLGRYNEAWVYYESRYAPSLKTRISTTPDLGFPQWQGESLIDKSLVIYAEQGYGDSIQFVRYVPLLRQRGVSRLTLVCRAPLQSLLETIDGVDAVVTEKGQVPAHDYWSLFLSLPLHFGTTLNTIPNEPLPYIRTSPGLVAKWRDRLPASGTTVGLVWKGNPGHKNDANRSLPSLASLAPLWSVPDVTFISLQKDQGEEEALQPPAEQPIVAVGAGMKDFADSAAIVSQLDLVICVDTAIAHVAGALGKPCWVLLPAMGTDWRWLLDRTDSPWYPSVRLFRQTNLENWSETIGEVADALKTWASVQS